MVTYRSRRAVAALFVVISSTLLAACNVPKVEEAAPPTTTTDRPTTTEPTSTNSVPKAPPVANPLDAGRFESKPCDSITPRQRRSLGITSAKPTNIARDGEECHFVRHPGDTILVVFASNVGDGLSSRYVEHSSGMWEQWQPTELDGYPALVFGTSDPNDCNFAVGLADTLYFWATVDDAGERCPRGRTAAAAVLATIKAAN